MLRRASLTPARWRESDISRGGARVMQPGMLFPNLYRCNKMLVNPN